jgi:hypothetical protein
MHGRPLHGNIFHGTLRAGPKVHASCIVPISKYSTFGIFNILREKLLPQTNTQKTIPGV